MGQRSGTLITTRWLSDGTANSYRKSDDDEDGGVELWDGGPFWLIGLRDSDLWWKESSDWIGNRLEMLDDGWDN